MQQHDVIVIGCGASGIAALRRLHDGGLKALGLEAAPRIGGRICTTPFGENVVDIGAAWCIGETSNIVYELASPHELLGRPNPDENWYVLSDGSLAPNILVQETVKTLSKAVEESSKDDGASISQCVRKAAELNETLRTSPLTKSIIEWYERTNHLGGQDDPRQGKSLRGLAENWPCAGELMLNWKGKGFKTILNVLLNKYPDPSKEVPLEILLNKEVESIRWGSSQSELDSSNPLVHVKCTDGSLFTTKSVIVTVSIGVLKERHKQLFDPALPQKKITSIDNLQLCVLGKIYVEFDEPWWPNSSTHFAVLWQAEDKTKYPQHPWVPEIYSVNTLDWQPNVLLMWLYGNGAKMMERASEEEVREGVDMFLEIFKDNFDVTPVKSIVRCQDVIVIGCGASGIAALRRLHDGGLKVLGLEAAPRIGGRICTTPFGENVVDIGAAWCHGETSNIVYELASTHELLGSPNPDENWYMLSGGSLAPNNLVQETVKTLSKAVEESSKDGGASISQCVRKATELSETLRTSPLTKSIIEWYERANHLGGQDDPRQGKSLRGLTENWPCAGEFMLNWKGKGYKTILDVLLNKYPDPSKEVPVEILLNKEVESIRWGSSQSELDSSKPLVHVKCTDGSLYTTKSVIVTVSIGVLKERHKELFNPALPQKKITSIDNLQLCVLDKIYVEFTEPWWPKSSTHFAVLWQAEDKTKYPQHPWVPEIYSVNTVDWQPNVLLMWLYGNGAKMMELASEEEVREGVDIFLEIFKDNFDVTPVKSIIRLMVHRPPLLNCMRQSPLSPFYFTSHPEDVVAFAALQRLWSAGQPEDATWSGETRRIEVFAYRSQWASNPLIRGAYSYRSVSTEEEGGGAMELSEPLYHADVFPVVCFGGEATSHHRHNSVHGAIEAGFREADRLIEKFEKIKL